MAPSLALIAQHRGHPPPPHTHLLVVLGVEVQDSGEQDHGLVVETILSKAGPQLWGEGRVGRFRWGYPREGWVRKERERISLASSWLCSKAAAISPGDNLGMGSKVKASASPNPSPLFKHFASCNSRSLHDRSVRSYQPYFPVKVMTLGQADSDGS